MLLQPLDRTYSLHACYGLIMYMALHRNEHRPSAVTVTKHARTGGSLYCAGAGLDADERCRRRGPVDATLLQQQLALLGLLPLQPQVLALPPDEALRAPEEIVGGDGDEHTSRVRHPVCLAADGGAGGGVAAAALATTAETDLRTCRRAAVSATRCSRGSSSLPHDSLFRTTTGRAARCCTMDAHSESIETSSSTTTDDTAGAAVSSWPRRRLPSRGGSSSSRVAGVVAASWTPPAGFLRTRGRSLLLPALASRACGLLDTGVASEKASYSDA